MKVILRIIRRSDVSNNATISNLHHSNCTINKTEDKDLLILMKTVLFRAATSGLLC